MEENKKKLNLSLFNMKKIKDNSNISIIGMRASGKSTLIRNILYHMQDSYIGGVFSRTERLNSFYSDFCPSDTIYHSFNKYVMIDIINQENKTHVINIMDDCFSSRTGPAPTQLIKDMMDKTHNMTNIFSFQFPLSHTNDFRSSLDYIFLMDESFVSNIKRLHTYTPFITEFDDFNKIFRRIMKVNNFNIMVIDNTNTSSKIEDRIFWYRAEEKLPKFEIKNYKEMIEIYNYYDEESHISIEDIIPNKNTTETDYNNDSDDSIPNKVDSTPNIMSTKIEYKDDPESSSDLSSLFAKNLTSSSSNIIPKSDMTISINNDNIVVNKNNITVNIKL